jgi:phage/plasmid-like protein (TIGR03299 family)
MSHAIEIDQATGIASFVAAREEAWHRLGDYQADRLLSIAEATDRAHLGGWDVHLVPVGALVDPSDPLSWTEVEGKRQPVRTNPHSGNLEVLGREQVGVNYQVFQNEATAAFAAQVAGVFGDEQIVSAAGSIMGGTRVFYCLALEGFTVLGEDAHNQWLTVMNGHDGSLNLTGLTGATRVVCKNTADWALAESTNVVRIRHSGNMEAKVEEAAHALEVARDWSTAYAKMAEHLASQKMSEKAFTTLVGKAYDLEVKTTDGNRTKARKTRDLEALTWNYAVSPTTEIGRGTKWAALNAITEWAEHGRPGDPTTDKAATLNLFGTPAQARAKAVKILTGAK